MRVLVGKLSLMLLLAVYQSRMQDLMRRKNQTLLMADKSTAHRQRSKNRFRSPARFVYLSLLGPRCLQTFAAMGTKQLGSMKLCHACTVSRLLGSLLGIDGDLFTHGSQDNDV